MRLYHVKFEEDKQAVASLVGVDGRINEAGGSAHISLGMGSVQAVIVVELPPEAEISAFFPEANIEEINQ